MTRKASKIIREGKTVLIEDGSKAPPMHTQYLNFLKQYPERIEEEDKKKVEEEVVRNRIDNALPPGLKKPSN